MIGQRLGNWELVKEIGRGGMGTVYLAEDKSHTDGEPRYAAVKVLAPQLAAEPGFILRFEREIAALRQLQHPHIVRFLDAGRHQQIHYYAMEYVDGVSFDAHLRERGRLPWDQVLDYALQICSALKHAHDHGIIHRDLKPPNLMVNGQGVVKLTDFGIARIFAEGRLTASNAVVGTADFMSPEQAAGKPVTRRSDLYSLGVLLYTMITGRGPFQASSVADMLHKHLYARCDPPQRFVADLPHEFDALIMQLMEKDPDKRPPDALVASRQLERIQRRAAQKSQSTQDEVRAGATQVIGQTEDAEAANRANPAKVVRKIMSTEWEALNRAGPIGRLFNRSWVLLLLLAGVVAVAVWGFWPKSVGDRIAAAREMVNNQEYVAAEKLLKEQQTRGPNTSQQEEIDELLHRIDRDRVLRQARKLAANWAGPFAAPGSEAERLYREGILAHYQGRGAEAREKWQLVIDAYSGVAALEPWVLLARRALSETDTAVEDDASLTAALALAKAEKPEEARRRLDALAKLYAGRDDAPARDARARIAAALESIKDPP